MNFLSGYRTYIAAAGLFILGVVDLIDGDQMAGVQKIVEAMGFFGLRAATSKVIDG